MQRVIWKDLFSRSSASRRRRAASAAGAALTATLSLFAGGCSDKSTPNSPDARGAALEPSADVRRYWFSDGAEITSYDLVQARYGELRRGAAVLVFVTEPFSRTRHVKLDHPESAGDDLSVVLKLNMEKKFQTGIYPYSMLLSTFTPVRLREGPALYKLSASSQEWCGHTFSQVNASANGWRFRQFSYFESEGDVDRSLERVWLEDELWSRIRLAPQSLPTGEVRAVPGFLSLRLRHTEVAPTPARATLEQSGATSIYRLNYEGDRRSLAIRFETAFPHGILGWEETYPDGFSDPAPVLTTTAERKRTIRSEYWSKNTNADERLARELGL